MSMIVDDVDLDRLLADLEAARAWTPRLVSRLEALLNSDDDGALFRVNPFTFARERNFDSAEVLDLFLHAASLGLFTMDWLLICPRCACAVESFARLRAVSRRFRCSECQNEYEAAMDDFIAVYFTVSPKVRSIRYHHPQTLEPFDYMYVFRGVREGRISDGTPFIDAVRERSLRSIGFLEPGETISFHCEATAGTLLGVSPDTDAGFILHVDDVPAAAPQRVRLTYLGHGYQPDQSRIASGPVLIEIVNTSSERSVVAILQGSTDEHEAFLQFEPYLTGKDLLTSQTFYSLFRSERVGSAQGLAIRDVALLFTDIKGSTVLYQRIGDLNAFELVQQHFDQLREATLQQGGAIVKTIGDAVMAVYPDALRAVAAGLEMRSAIERFSDGQPERAVSVKIGIHHGAAIAVTLNDQLDYFGHTVNIASRVQEMADAGEIWITQDVWEYPGVQALLDQPATVPQDAWFKGIDQPIKVVRIDRPMSR